jgi:hypothetical protein
MKEITEIKGSACGKASYKNFENRIECESFKATA